MIALHHPIHNPASPLKSLLEGLSDADALIDLLGDVPRGLILHGHLHRRVKRALMTRAGSLTSVGATSASLHHDDEARFAGYNIYEFDDSGAVLHLDARVFEPAASRPSAWRPSRSTR